MTVAAHAARAKNGLWFEETSTGHLLNHLSSYLTTSWRMTSMVPNNCSVRFANTGRLGVFLAVADRSTRSSCIAANIAFNLDLILGAEGQSLFGSERPDATLRRWKSDRDKLLSLLRETISCAREQDLSRILFKANEEEPGWSVGYKLAASAAKHRAYHRGQIEFNRDAYLSKNEFTNLGRLFAHPGCA